jgi:hypothetical protein
VEIDDVRALKREANARIAQVARETLFSAPVPFICECGDPACRGVALLAQADFDQMVKEPAQFLVGEAHGFLPGVVVTPATWSPPTGSVG